MSISVSIENIFYYSVQNAHAFFQENEIYILVPAYCLTFSIRTQNEFVLNSLSCVLVNLKLKQVQYRFYFIRMV